MKIIIRVDSSVKMGSGHLMRCLTLADKVREKSVDVSFIYRELPGRLCSHAEKKGYKVHKLPIVDVNTTENYEGQPLQHAHWLGVDWETDASQTIDVLSTGQQADWLIVDHYAIDFRWEEKLRPYTKKIMVIDDLADRKHDCDLLLDQNLYEDMETRYDKLVPENCVKLLGPKYALLRHEFIEARKNLKMRDGIVRRILIFFGGSDLTNETAKALEALMVVNRHDIIVDVIVGSSNPHKEQIAHICSTMPNTNYYCQVDNMAKLMAEADLTVGAGGSTTWERCFLGLPTVTLVIADNQAETTAAVARAGASLDLGWANDVSIEGLAVTLKKLLENPWQMKEMSNISKSLVNIEIESILKVMRKE